MTDKVVNALNKLEISAITDLLCEKLETLKKMQAPHKVKNTAGDKTTVMKAVHHSTVLLVLIFIDFCHYLRAKHGNNINWLTVTEQEFSDFCVLPEYMQAVNPTPGRTKFTPGPNPRVIGPTSTNVLTTTTATATTTTPSQFNPCPG